MLGIIYFARCSINGKYYVGKTGKSLKRRRIEHESCSRTLRPNKIVKRTIFHVALAAHGLNNFEWGVLGVYATKEELDSAEVYFIDIANSYVKDWGYNLTRGGDGGEGYLQTIKVRRHHSKMLLGKKASPEARKNISTSCTFEDRSLRSKKSWTPERKAKYKEQMRLWWATHKLVRSEEQRKNHSILMKKRWADGEYGAHKKISPP